MHYTALLLWMSLGASALAANLSEIQVFYRLDPWLVSGNYVGGLWASPPVLGPVTQGGLTFSLEAKAQGLDLSGQTVAVTPQWISSDPNTVMVSPGQGAQVTMVVLRAGQSTLTVSDQGISKQLAVKAALSGPSLVVEISQQPFTPLPALTASPTLLSFQSQVGGAATPPQALTVGSSNGAALPFTVSSDAPWLSVSPASAITPSSLGVSANPANVAVGTHAGVITVASPGMATAQTVAVVLNVSDVARPSLLVSPAALVFSSQSGGPDASPQSASVGSGGVPVSFSAAVSSGANWLSVTANSETTPATLAVSVHAAGLAEGTYSGTVTVSSASTTNTLQNLGVTLTVTKPAPGPALSLSPSTVMFTLPAGTGIRSAQSAAIGSTGPALAFTVTAASPSGSWLSVSPPAALTPATVSISADTHGLAPGTYSGAVSVSATGATNSPQVLPVTLVVTPPASPGTPELRFVFGALDRQVNGDPLLVISGSGQLSSGSIQGSGRFTEFTLRDGKRTVLRHGTWIAKRVLSFSPATPMTRGSRAAGILTIEVGLKVLPPGSGEISATLSMAAELPGGAKLPDSPSGVRLTIPGGVAYVPGGPGSVVFLVPGNDGDRERERDGGR
jgi:hypothetical protein